MNRSRECERLLDPKYRVTYYDPRLNVHNTLAHELAKCKLVYFLKKAGKKVVAEAIFKNGGRADILVLDDFRVFEVLKSEKEKEALIKTAKYPSELDIVYIRPEEVEGYVGD